LVVANNGGTGGVLQQKLSSQPVLTSAYPFNPLEDFSPYTVIHMLSNNFKESQDFSQDSSMCTTNIRSKAVCVLQKDPRTRIGSAFEGTVENCLRNSRAGRILQADYELLADSLWTVRSALDMASQGFHVESSWRFI
jgi:hypothetical protein